MAGEQRARVGAAHGPFAGPTYELSCWQANDKFSFWQANDELVRAELTSEELLAVVEASAGALLDPGADDASPSAGSVIEGAWFGHEMSLTNPPSRPALLNLGS